MFRPNLILLALLLQLVATHAFAEDWQELGGSRDGSVKELIDAASIKPHGEFSEAWVMINFASVQKENGMQFQSIKMQQIFDCHGKRTATPQHLAYAGSKGSGDIVYQHKPEDGEALDLQETAADSPNGSALIFVCHYVRDHAPKQSNTPQ